MPTTYATSPIRICTDCRAMLANHHVTDSDGNDITTRHADAMTTVWGHWHAFLTLDDEPLGFSTGICDGCNSELGGDRFAAHYHLTTA